MKKLDFWYFWNLTLKHWRWLVCWVIIGGAAGFVLATYVLKPQYEAVVSLYVGRSVPVDNVSQTEEEMRSSSINSELALALQLVSDYKELIDSKLIRNKVDQRVEEDYPDLPLVYKVRVNLVRGSRLIKVSVNSRNPKTCEVIANTMADVFIDEVQKIDVFTVLIPVNDDVKGVVILGLHRDELLSVRGLVHIIHKLQVAVRRQRGSGICIPGTPGSG